MRIVPPPYFRRTLAGVPSHWLGFARPSRCRLCRSWLRSPDGSAQLLDADQVARGIAEGAVANPVRLLNRLLDDLGVAGLQPLEGAVEVDGGQVDGGVSAFGHHLGDRTALVLGDAGGCGRWVEHDGSAGLVGGA